MQNTRIRMNLHKSRPNLKTKIINGDHVRGSQFRNSFKFSTMLHAVLLFVFMPGFAERPNIKVAFVLVSHAFLHNHRFCEENLYIEVTRGERRKAPVTILGGPLLNYEC